MTEQEFFKIIYDEDEENISLYYHLNYENLEQKYRVLSKSSIWRDRNEEFCEYYRSLRIVYRASKKEIVIINELINAFYDEQSEYNKKLLAIEIDNKIEAAQHFVLETLKEVINEYNLKVSFLLTNASKVSAVISKDSRAFLDLFFQDLLTISDIFFKAKIQKTYFDKKIPEIIDKLDNMSNGTKLVITTCYYLKQIIYDLPNPNDNDFDYSCITMLLYKACEKIINGIMIYFAKLYDYCVLNIPYKPKKEFYFNGRATWYGISLGDKLLFFSSIYDDIKKIKDLKKEYKDATKEKLLNWQKSRNAYMHSDVTTSKQKQDLNFKETLGIIYFLLQIVYIMDL